MFCKNEISDHDRDRVVREHGAPGSSQKGREMLQESNGALLFRYVILEETFVLIFSFLADSKCWLTGSYAAGVDLHTSDLDFTVKAPSVNGSNQCAKLLEIRNRLRYIHIKNVNVFEKVYVQKGTIPVLQMVHAETGVSIDVTIDNDTAKRNTQLLCWYGQRKLFWGVNSVWVEP